MGIELAIIGIALVLALVLKGSPKSILKTKLKHKWTLLVALAGHVFIELEPISESMFDTVGFGVLMLTYVMLLTFCIANFQIRPLIAIFIGLSSNAFVTALNGHMPVTTANGFNPKESIRYSAESSQDIIPELGSSIPINAIGTALSPGDLIFAFGMFMFFYSISRKKAPVSEEHHVDLTNASLVQPADEVDEYNTMEVVMTDAALAKNQVLASSIMDKDEYVDIRIDEDLDRDEKEPQDEDLPSGSGNVAVLEKEEPSESENDRELVDAASSSASLRSSQKPQRSKNQADSADKLNRKRSRRARKKWQQTHGLNALPKPEELGFDEDSMTIVDAAK